MRYKSAAKKSTGLKDKATTSVKKMSRPNRSGGTTTKTVRKTKRPSFLDVLRGANTKKKTTANRKEMDKARTKRMAKDMTAKTKKRRSATSKMDEPSGMLKKGKRTGNADASVKKEKTKGGTYPVYKKKSDTAKSFRSAFADARKSGKKIFTWNGKKYNTKVK